MIKLLKRIALYPLVVLLVLIGLRTPTARLLLFGRNQVQLCLP